MKHKFGLFKKCLSIFLMITLIIQLSSINIYAYVDSLGNVLNTSKTENSLTVELDNGVEDNNDILEISICSNNIVKFNYRPNGVDPSQDTPMIDSNKEWNYNGNITILDDQDPMIVSTDDLNVEISKSPCRITIKDSTGKNLLWESSDMGIYSNGIRFKHNTQDNLYGIRGYNFTEGDGDILRNDSSHPAHAGQQGDVGGPFVWSTNGYGVLVDSDGGYPYTNSKDGKLEFYYGDTIEEGRRYNKVDVDCYVMTGKPNEIMNSYANITGKTPMLPKWSAGFSNFEWKTDENEVKNMIDTYQSKDIPVSSYGLDYDWKNYGDDNYGEFSWNTTNFPGISNGSFKDYMNSKGIHLIGITKPRIVTLDKNSQRTVQFNDAEAGNYWYPNHYEYKDYFIPVKVRSIDPYNANFRDWFWQHSITAFDQGIDGWWNDETDKVSSGSAQYWFGNFTTTHLSQALYEGQRDYTNQRVWQTARTYYPGAQRYGTSIWSGDIGSQYCKGNLIDWAVGMKEQKATMLSSINMGQLKWGMDIGGFNQGEGVTKNPEPELYTKWITFGAFVPVFRVHGNLNQQRQPWFYGKTAEEMTKYMLRLRYQLAPYVYHYDRTAYENGNGLVKPLAMVYPNDEKVKDDVDSWMFGDYLLVAPVVEKNQKTKEIYLPEGKWIDYYTGIEYQGGKEISLSLDNNSWTSVPLFIKSGAIIPSETVESNLDNNIFDDLNIDIFPNSISNEFELYDDDGKTYDYENMNYFKQNIKAIKNSNNVELTLEGKTGNYNISNSIYELKVHGIAATDVSINNNTANNLNETLDLSNLNINSFAVGNDVYGKYTLIKVNGANTEDVKITLTGNMSTNNKNIRLEAEDASLSGKDLTTKAKVNTNHSGYSGEGFVEGFNNEGAKVTFYSKTKQPGEYDVNIKYSNGFTENKTASLYVNGEFYKTIDFAPTGSWDTWSSLQENINLTGGHDSISIEYDSEKGDLGNINIDYIDIPINTDTIIYQAENCILSGGAKTNVDHFRYEGSGFVDALSKTNSKIELDLKGSDLDTPTLKVRYANGSGVNKNLSLYVNNTKLTNLEFDPTDNWDDWNTISIPLNDSNDMKLEIIKDSNNTGQVNIDALYLTTDPNYKFSNNYVDNGDFERIGILSAWKEWHPDNQKISFGVDSGSGMNPPESALTKNYRTYFWNNSPYQQSIHQDFELDNGTYEFEAWVKLSNSNPNVARAELSNFGGDQVFIDLTTNNKWSYINKEINVLNGFIDLGFYVDSPGNTTVLIDDVKLIKK